MQNSSRSSHASQPSAASWLPLVAAGVLLATIMAILAVFVAPLTHAASCGTSASRYAPCAVQHRAVTNAAVTATDPGQAVYAYVTAHGATPPAAWARTVDDNRTQICHEYAIGYANEPAGARDEWGVTVPLAEAAISATGFCS